MQDMFIDDVNPKCCLCFCHSFDYEDNLFFQLNGHKTFILSPPSLGSYPLFPFLHESERQVCGGNVDDENVEYTVTLRKGDVLYLPSFWYHEVVNGEEGSYGVNLWILNRKLHAPLDRIENYPLPKDLADSFRKGVKKSNFRRMLHFIWTLESAFCDRIAADSEHCHAHPVLMRYFGETYPILSDIQRHHLFLEGAVTDNFEFLSWFIDVNHFKNMLKCNAMEYKEKKFKALSTLFHKRRHAMTCSVESIDYPFMDDLMSLLEEVKEMKGEQVAVIPMAMLIEGILHSAFGDVQFLPLTVALQFL